MVKYKVRVAKEKLTKDDVIKYIVDRIHLWDISKKDAEKAVKDIPDQPFRKYSVWHYKTVYQIVQAKLKSIGDNAKDSKSAYIEQIAYLDCLAFNYKDMESEKPNEALDIASSLFTLGFLGLSFETIIENSTGWNTFILFWIAVLLQFLKLPGLLVRRWGFYQMVIEQLKDEVSASNTDQHSAATVSGNL